MLSDRATWSAAVALRAEMGAVSMKALVCYDIKTASGPHRIQQSVELDEVVIPGVLHIEAMGRGVWHVALGDGAVTLSVSAHGVTVVEIADNVLRAIGRAP